MATRALTRNARAAESRDAILAAALAEFAQQGVAGARTDAIAKAAGVNKALLYYYFKDKEALYGAVVSSVFQRHRETVWPVLEQPGTAGERLMRYLAAYFDFFARSPELPGLFQHELMRGGRLRSPHLKRLVVEHFRPISQKLHQLLSEGIDTSEFRPVNVMHFPPSMHSVALFYFTGLPIVRFIVSGDPLSPERLRERRAAVLDFVSHSLFADSARADAVILKIMESAA